MLDPIEKDAGVSVPQYVPDIHCQACLGMLEEGTPVHCPVYFDSVCNTLVRYHDRNADASAICKAVWKGLYLVDLADRIRLGWKRSVAIDRSDVLHLRVCRWAHQCVPGQTSPLERMEVLREIGDLDLQQALDIPVEQTDRRFGIRLASSVNGDGRSVPEQFLDQLMSLLDDGDSSDLLREPFKIDIEGDAAVDEGGTNRHVSLKLASNCYTVTGLLPDIVSGACDVLFSREYERLQHFVRDTKSDGIFVPSSASLSLVSSSQRSSMKRWLIQVGMLLGLSYRSFAHDDYRAVPLPLNIDLPLVTLQSLLSHSSASVGRDDIVVPATLWNAVFAPLLQSSCRSIAQYRENILAFDNGLDDTDIVTPLPVMGYEPFLVSKKRRRDANRDLTWPEIVAEYAKEVSKELLRTSWAFKVFYDPTGVRVLADVESSNRYSRLFDVRLEACFRMTCCIRRLLPKWCPRPIVSCSRHDWYRGRTWRLCWIQHLPRTASRMSVFSRALLRLSALYYKGMIVPLCLRSFCGSSPDPLVFNIKVGYLCMPPQFSVSHWVCP